MAIIQHESDMRVDTMLTNLLLGYGSQANIGDKIFPAVSVKEDTGKFFVWDQTNGMNITGIDPRRADDAKVRLIESGVSQDTYKVDQYALGRRLPDSFVKNAMNVLSIRQATAMHVIDTLDTYREKAAATLAFTNANYDSNLRVTLATNDRWSIAHTDSNPIADIAEAKFQMLKQIGVVPGARLRLVIGPDGEKFLRQHSLIKDQVKYIYGTGYDNMSLEAIAPIIGVDEILVGRSRYNTAKDGQTATPGFIWQTHAALIMVQDSPVINAPSFGYRFVPGHTPRTVETYRPEGMRAEQIDVNEKWQLKICMNKAAYFFNNAFDVS